MLGVDFEYVKDGKRIRHVGAAQNFVPVKLGTGSRLVIAEAPGETEAALGEPLVGASGQFFDSLCSKAGVHRAELTLLNTIQCRPPDNIYPLSSDARQYISKSDAEAAVEHCYRRHVLPEIDGRNWERIDVLGDRALTVVTGLTGIYKWRGSIVASLAKPERANIVPTIHPAGLMREQTYIPVVISDLKKSLVQPPENYNLYPSVGDLEKFIESTTEFAFDLETNYHFHNEIYMCGLSSRPFEGLVVPWKGPYIALVKRLFAKATSVIGQNLLGFDLNVLEKNGVFLNKDAQVWDVMLAHHLVAPDLPHDLEFIASIFCNKTAWKHLEKENKELYCMRDTDVTIQIFPQLRALLRQQDLMDLYNLISVPLAKICFYMKEKGVKLDPSRIKEVRERLLISSEELEKQLPEFLRTKDEPCRKRVPAPPGLKNKAGKMVRFQLVDSSKRKVPWRSDTVIGEWLYGNGEGQLGLEVQYHLKTKQTTTDKIALDKLFRKSRNPAILAVKKLRGIDETLTTFTKEKLTLASSVHSNFLVHGTATGRLSSSEPNLQNVTEEARVIYIPHYKDWLFVSCDWSSLENRLSAWFADDQPRMRRFNTPGFNEHKFAASKFFHISIEDIEKSNDNNSEYMKAKHIVHGADGALGPRKISLLYDMPEAEVKTLLKKWKDEIFYTVKWQERVGNAAKKEGVLTNGFGRKRWFWTTSAYTEGIRTLPQGSGADIMLRCMLAMMYDRVGWPLEKVQKVASIVEPLPKPAELLITVHDSLVVETPPELLDKVVSVMKAVMTQPWECIGGFSCPIDISVGPSWGELEPYVSAQMSNLWPPPKQPQASM